MYYEKILVPLDQTPESESVLPFIEELLAPGGEGILLHIIRPGRTKSWGEFGEFVMLGTQIEEELRDRAMARLRMVVTQIGDGPGRWRCEVVISSSVADGIADFARREQVGLIAMYTHDRKGLAKLIKGSIAEKVQKRATTEVQIFWPRELAAV